MKASQNEQSDGQNDNTNLSERIGQRLKEFRIRLGYTQIRLAMDLNVTEQALMRYEHGTCRVPLDILASLHENYHIDLNYLICGDASSSNNKTCLIIEDLKKLVHKYDLS